jgi:hypothetical protein
VRPWQNKKAILAVVLLVAAAAGGSMILNSRRGDEGRQRAKPAVVKAGMGAGPGAVAGKPAAAKAGVPGKTGTASVPGAAVAKAQGAAAAVAKAQAPAAQIAQAGAAEAPAPGTVEAEAAAGNSAVAPPFTQEPESDPTDRLAHWVRQPYYYASLGRRDPFASLVSGDFESDGEVGLVDVGDMKLVGIAWDEIDRFAMVEDSRGFGHALREGDQVRSGKVLRIERDSVTFLQTSAGESTTITIELPIREGD